MIDCRTWVVSHRPFPVAQVDMYRKLCVGDYHDDISASEAEGKNIRQYNDRLNEMTGLYWIWKNTDSKYVGMCHYRRFFQNCGHRLDSQGVEDILVADGYDMILAPKQLNWNLAENLRQAVGLERASKASHIMLDEIMKHQPEYSGAFVDVLSGKSFYYCNMFVTRREILNEYCEWLFSFITEAADRIDVTGANSIERRTAGYLGEMMMSVWLKKHTDLKIYELPLEVIR